MLLMVEIAKSMKPMLKTAEPFTASCAAVTVKLQRSLMKAKLNIHRHLVSGLVLPVVIHRSPIKQTGFRYWWTQALQNIFLIRS